MDVETTDVTTKDSEMADTACAPPNIDGYVSNPEVTKEVDHSDADGGKTNVDDTDSSIRKKKRGRRRRPKGGGRHHWKPYDQLSWVQKCKLDERETKRATKKREAAFESGHPVAPYNTTQFLIEDHLQNGQSMSPDLELKLPQPDNCGDKSVEFDSESEPSIDDLNDSPTDEMFLAKDFSEAYTNIHAERLQNLPKAELIREYLALESRNEALEDRLKKLTGRNTDANNDKQSVSNLMDEIERLREDNTHLRAAKSNDGDL